MSSYEKIDNGVWFIQDHFWDIRAEVSVCKTTINARTKMTL